MGPDASAPKNYKNLSPQAGFLQPEKPARFLLAFHFRFHKVRFLRRVVTWEDGAQTDTEGDFSCCTAPPTAIIHRPPPTAIETQKNMHSQLSSVVGDEATLPAVNGIMHERVDLKSSSYLQDGIAPTTALLRSHPNANTLRGNVHTRSRTFGKHRNDVIETINIT